MRRPPPDPAALPFRKERLLAAGTLALLAPIPLVFTESLAPAILAVYSVTLCGLLVSVRAGRVPCLPNWAMNLVGLAYIFLFWFDVRFGSRSLLRTALHILLFTTVVKLASVKRERDLAVCLVLSTFLLVASMATSSHSTILLFLVFYAAVAWPILSRLALFRDLADAEGEWRRDPEARRLPSRRAVALSLLGAFAAAVPFFVVLPRLKTSYLQGRPDGREAWTGFTDSVDSGLYGRLRRSDKVFLRLLPDEGIFGTDFTGLRLRLVALSRFSAGIWAKPDVGGRVIGTRPDVTFPLASPARLAEGPRRSLSVELAPLGTRYLPYPDTALTLRLGSEIWRRLGGAPLVRDNSGNLRLPFEPEQLFLYSVEVSDRPIVDQRPPEAGEGVGRATGSERVRAFGRDVSGGADPSTEPELFARRVESFLSLRFFYSLEVPAPRPGTDPVEEFLYSRRSGHCETFATAMTLVLRENGIPARFVTGFSGGEVGPFGQYLLVRGKDAHAWVEAGWGPGRGWVTFDPTPPDGRPTVERVPWTRKLGQFVDNLEFLYGRWVLSFGQSDQAEIARRLREAFLEGKEAVGRRLAALGTLARSASAAGRMIVLVGVLALLIVALRAAVRRLPGGPRGFVTRGLPPASAAYRRLQRFLRAGGAPLTPASAPAETLAAAGVYGRSVQAAAKALVALYVLESFGGGLREEESRRAAELLRQVRRSVRAFSRRSGGGTRPAA